MEQPAPAYQGNQPYVFICYSHEDKSLVFPQITWLQDQGVKVWYDEGISPGEEWSEELGHAIEGAARFLIFVTPASVASTHCRDEVHYAKNHNIPILAVYLKKTALPAGLELALGANQAVLAYELEDAAYRRKIESALTDEHLTLPDKPGESPQRVRKRRVAWVVGTSFAILIVFLTAIWFAANRSTDATPRDRSITVVRYETNESDIATRTYATGLTQELRARIAGYPELKTIVDAAPTDRPRADSSSTAAPSYQLAGNVQKVGEVRRVRAELIRMPDKEIVWTETYDEMPDADDPSLLASTIGRFVRLQLWRDHQCEAVKQATRSALAARYTCAALAENLEFNQGGQADPELMRSNAERAISLDASLVEPYWLAGIYYAYNLEREVAHEAGVAKARQLVETGASLAPDDPLMLFNRAASLHIKTDFNYLAAETDLRRAIELDPLHPAARWFHAALGASDLYQGKLEEALRHFRRATSIYDSDARIWAEFARVLNMAGDHEEALSAAEAALSLVSTGVYQSIASLEAVHALWALGETESAKNAINSSIEKVPMYRAFWTPDMKRLGMNTLNIHDLTRMAQAANPYPALIFMGYMGLGATDEAFEWLYKSIDDRDPWIVGGLRLDPRFDSLRKDRRWTEVLRYLEAEEAKFAQ